MTNIRRRGTYEYYTIRVDHTDADVVEHGVARGVRALGRVRVRSRGGAVVRVAAVAEGGPAGDDVSRGVYITGPLHIKKEYGD